MIKTLLSNMDSPDESFIPVVNGVVKEVMLDGWISPGMNGIKARE